MIDTLQNKQHFINQIIVYQESIRELRVLINKNKAENINLLKNALIADSISILLAQYSGGISLNEVKKQLVVTIKLIETNWNDSLKVTSGKITLNQYDLETYDHLLWLLSLGYLLNIENNDFNKLVQIIDKDGVKDKLYEYIIKAKIPDRPTSNNESYQSFFGVPLCYEKIREAIEETDKKVSEGKIKEYITKIWYKNHHECGWYDNHKTNKEIYLGYWSFETAAIVKILEINDNQFINCEYYPKDLVHNREN